MPKNADQEASMTPEAIRQTLHQVRTHQLELETQNKELRRVITELDASKARYFDFYNFAPVGFVTVSELGTILEANLTFGLMLGVPHSTLVNQSIFRLFFKLDQDTYYHLGKKLVDTGEPQSCELRMLKHHGDYFWVQLKAVAAQHDGTPAWRLVVSDISVRQKRETELQHVTERFELAVAGSNDGLWDWDFTTNTVFYSPRFKQLLGFSPDDPRFPNVYSSLRKRLHPDDFQSTEDAIQRAVIDGVPYRAVFRLQTAAGDWRWFEARGATLRNENNSATRLSGSISDITDRKNAEEILRQNELALKEAQRLAHIGSWYWNAVSDIQIWSDELYKIFAHDRSAPLPNFEQHLRIYTQESGRLLTATVEKAMQTGEPYEIDLEQACTDGKQRWVTARGESVRDPEGRIVGLRGTVQQITERKLAEQALLQAKALAESASRAKSEFLATMSHEIRTPMNGVVGFTELLLDTALDEQQRQFVELLRNSSSTLLSVINDILDFSSIESGQMSLVPIECDAGQLIEEQAAIFEPQARSLGLEWSVNLSLAPSRLIRADPVRFRKICGYLLHNALKFTKHGRIGIVLHPMRKGGRSQLCISISDTGIGIPRENQAKLFQSFSQADGSSTRVYGGTGLGLAISKKLVELMGGQIGFESEAGRGSTFWFTVPDVAAKAGPAAQPHLSTNPTQSGEVRPLDVLVVEDNFVNQQLAKHHLQRLGCTVTVAAGGAKAVELVRSQRYDLIFMDCMMPEMDGYETTGIIRKWEQQNRTHPHLPIIALTANAMAGDRERCLSSGMDDYLSKPIVAVQLAQMIEKWRPAPALTR